MAEVPPRERVDTLRRLDEAAAHVRHARRVLAELHGRINDIEDMEWLVGLLAVHAQPGTMLPPRLAPLVHHLTEKYLREGTGRFTVAVPVENVRPGE